MNFKVGDEVLWLHEDAKDTVPQKGKLIKKAENYYAFYFEKDGSRTHTPVHERELTLITKLHKVLE